MKKESTLLSVIIAVKNGEKFIEKCIDSINENYDSKKYNIEIIVVNDNSKDNTMKVVETLSKKYKNIKSTNSDGFGVSEARNTGINMASGEYVVFFDADDYVDENFSKAVELLNNDIDIYLFDMIYETKDSSKTLINYPDEICGKVIKTENVEFIKLCKFYNNCAPCKIVKREFLLKNDIKFKKFSVAEDMEWSIRLVINNPKIFTSKYSYYHYVKHETSVMNSANFTRTRDGIEACKEGIKDIDESSLNSNQKKILKKMVISTQYSTFQFYKRMNKEDRKLFKEYLRDYQKWLGKPTKFKFWLIRICLLVFGLDVTLFLTTKLL